MPRSLGPSFSAWRTGITKARLEGNKCEFRKRGCLSPSRAGVVLLYGPNSTVPGLLQATPLLGPGFGRHVLGSEACGSGTRWLGSARGHPNAPNWCVWSVLSGHLWYEESTFKVVRLMSPLPPSPWWWVGPFLAKKNTCSLVVPTSSTPSSKYSTGEGGRPPEMLGEGRSDRWPPPTYMTKGT